MRFGRSSPVLQGGVIALLSLFCEINAAVSPQGVYTHAIPISIPPALAGVGPEDLSLVYNSGNGSSSIAGVGWSLTGIPMIGRAKGMHYHGQDSYHIGGQKLLRQPNGNYSAGTTGFIPQLGDCGLPENEPCSWLGKPLNGTTIHFGSGSNSRASAAGKSGYRVWAADRIENSAGLYYTIEYLASGGELYPEHITYTFGPTSQLYRRVEFFYEDEPQPHIILSDGVPVSLNKRLKRIVVKLDRYCADLFVTTACFGDSNFRTYNLKYTTSTATGRNLLSGVDVIDENGALLPASATFSYSGSTLTPTYNQWPAGTATHMANGGGLMGQYAVVTGDFNGDGITDIATVHKPQVANGWSQWIALEISTKTGFRSEVWNSQAVQQMYASGGGLGHYAIVPGDFNGDGRTDIAFARKSAVGPGDVWYNSIIIEYSTGSDFNSVVSGNPIAKLMYETGGETWDYRFLPADIDKNGTTDIVVTAARLFPPPGWSFSGRVCGLLPQLLSGIVLELCPPPEPSLWADYFAILRSNYGFGLTTAEFWRAGAARHMYNGDGTLADYKILPLDMDADGRTDIVVVRRGGGGWSEWFAVEKSTGSGFVSETWRTPTAAALASSAGDFTVIPGDFNGDGRIDLATVQQVNTQDMSVCESEAMCGTPSASDPWFRGIFVDLNTGSGFVPQYWSAQSPGKMAQAGNTLQFYKILPVDVNADGKTDLVFSRAGGLDNWLTGWNGVLQIEISEGSGFRSEARASSLTTAMTSGGLGAEYELLAGDVNADGLPDLVVMTNHHLPQSGFVGLELSPGSVPDQLIGKQTVFGIREELEYRLSTHLQWAHKPKVGFYSHPFRLWNIPQSVAVRHKLFGNGLLQSHTEYDYRHAKAYIENNGNLRYLGFGEVIEYDRLRGRRRETVYFQEPGYSMKPRHSAAYLPSGKLAHYEEHRPPLWLIEAWHREHPNDDLPELDENLTYVRSETSENGYGMARVREPVPESMAVEHVRPRLVFHHDGGLSYKTFTDYEGDRPVAVVTAPIDEATDSMLRPSSVGVDELRGQFALELSDRITQAMGLASVVKNDGSISGRKYEVYYSGNDRRNGRPDRITRDLGRLWDAASQTSSRRQLVTGYVYNQAGLVRSEYSVNNYASKLYDYDYQFGQFVAHTRDCPARARDESASNCVSRYSQFDPRFGKAIMVGDYDKGFDITRYDTVGRPVEALSYDNQGRLLSKLTTNYTEDMNGLTVRACQHFGRDFIQQSCSLTVTDSFGREKLKVTPSVQGEANEVTHTAVQVEYDAQFRKVRESLPYFSDAHGAGTPTSWMVYEYDERDRIVKIVAADGRITRFEHNIPYEECQSVCRPLVGVASRMTTIESGGKRRDIYKNAQGKPLRVVDGARSTHERVTEFEYYPNGKLKTIYAPNDTIKYTYWHAADLVETIETRHGAEGYKYDVSGMALDGSQGTGSLLKPIYVSRYRRGAGGEIIADSNEERRYDQWGRLTATLSNISSPGGMDEETQYLYDESESSFGKGRLTSVRHKSRLNGNVPFDAHGLMTASSVCKRLHYDARGRIIGTVTDTSNDPNCLTDMAALPQHAVTTAEFDELGRKTAVVYPDMARSEFRYAGGTGLVSEILHEGSVLAHYRDYNSSGKYGNAVLANGIRQEYTFDDETQLLSQLTVRNSANRRLVDLAYSFDGQGNLSAIADHIMPEASYTYAYDLHYRLQSAERGDGEQFKFAFDRLGNLLQKEYTHNTFTAGSTTLARSEVRKRDGSAALTIDVMYDEWGNLTEKSSATFRKKFAYSDKNRLFYAEETAGDLAGQRLQFFYDEAGQRYQKILHSRCSGEGAASCPVGRDFKVHTYYLGGLEIRQKWENGAWLTQKQRFIFAPSGERLAMVVDDVQSGLVALTNDSRYYLARAYLTDSHTFTGLGRYTGYLATAFALKTRDLATQYRRELLLALIAALFLALTLMAYRENEGLAAFRRSIALVTAAAFLTANCARSNPALQSPGYTTQGDATMLDYALAGVAAGIYFYHQNHLQSAVLITDGKGAEIMRLHYLPFGEIDQRLTGRLDPDTGELIQNTAQVPIGSAAARYTDQTLDYETELMYYNARYYDPQLGVFTSADSVIPDGGDPLAYNRHAYVRGNPIRYSDPTGHFWWVVPFLVGAIIGGIAAGTGGNIAGWINGDVSFNWGAAWKGGLAGGFAAVAGVGVSLAVAGAAPLAAKGTLALALAQGATAGYAAGFVGASSHAWFSGAGFWDGFAAGMIGGSIGAVSGMALGLVAHGWDAMNDSPFDPNVMEDADHIPDIREGMDSRVTSKYGPRKFTDSGFHRGTDYAAPNGTPIYSKADGVVEYVNFGGPHTNGDWGNHIIIDHGNGLKTYHMHMSQTALKRGTPIFRGQPLGLSGSTGTYVKDNIRYVVAPHYHYAVRVLSVSTRQGFVNPQTFDWYWHQKYGVPYFPKMW